MKKLVLMFAAVAAISFASCGGAATDNASGTDAVEAVEVEVEEVPADSIEVIEVDSIN